MYGALHQAVGFEGSQGAGQHALAYAFYGAVQVVVAVGAGSEEDHQEHAPLVAYSAEDVGHRACGKFFFWDGAGEVVCQY
ncbi:hypothetical protein GCM10009677_06930 [Sphaerisporangium rubeum]